MENNDREFNLVCHINYKEWYCAIILFALIFIYKNPLLGQDLKFNSLSGISGYGRDITWTTSEWGSGFGHRISNMDIGGYTTFSIDSRHNSPNWVNTFNITSLGHVGIGTLLPSNDQGWHRVVEINGGQHSKLLISSQNKGVKVGIYAHYSWGDGPKGVIGTESNHDLSIHTDYDKERIRIKNNGNVGIGTSAPTSKLDVNGTIRAKEIKVEATNWPDYVFEPNYELMDLKDVSDYIQIHKHLPGIPSEITVQNSGLLLGEMNALLLKKIEELVLYTISQQTRIQLLEELIEKSDDNICYLEREILKLKEEYQKVD
ncbi:hypothetical protein [Anditalea andensis]|uniref:Peptidase S74 domain-containing protein n=1 Tax=Anditalea andensis TaxID=1048983 RepID=A0A074KRW5_9BACT|nr:hypothetical protein [Anditalea andensis]KEO71614.1 hypothetical protein EL17_24010 [Anditalea andensis]